MSLFMHVAIVVAIGYHSVYLTTAPLLLASSVLFLVKSCIDKQFRTWRLGPKLTHCLIAASTLLLLYFSVAWMVKYSTGWEPPICGRK